MSPCDLHILDDSDPASPVFLVLDSVVQATYHENLSKAQLDFVLARVREFGGDTDSGTVIDGDDLHYDYVTVSFPRT